MCRISSALQYESCVRKLLVAGRLRLPGREGGEGGRAPLRKNALGARGAGLMAWAAICLHPPAPASHGEGLATVREGRLVRNTGWPANGRTVMEVVPAFGLGSPFTCSRMGADSPKLRADSRALCPFWPLDVAAAIRTPRSLRRSGGESAPGFGARAIDALLPLPSSAPAQLLPVPPSLRAHPVESGFSPSPCLLLLLHAKLLEPSFLG